MEEDHPVEDQAEEECSEEALLLQEVPQWHHQDQLNVPHNNMLHLKAKGDS